MPRVCSFMGCLLTLHFSSKSSCGGPSHYVALESEIEPVYRWDEKAGLRRDAIRSQWSTRSKRNRKETGYEKDYHCAGIPERTFQGAKADDRFGSGRSLVVLLCFG